MTILRDEEDGWATHLRGLEPYIRSGTVGKAVSGIDVLPPALLRVLNEWGIVNIINLSSAMKEDFELPQNNLFILSIDKLEPVRERLRACGFDTIPYLVLMDNGSIDFVKLVSVASTFSSVYVVHDARLSYATFGHHSPADVSLIIALPRTPKTDIERCADSLFSQDFVGRLELLFFGADDNAAAAVERAAALHKSIISRVFCGSEEQASARNRGMACAKGTFVGFVEPGDYVSPDYVDSLYRKALLNDSEIVETFYGTLEAGENYEAPNYDPTTSKGPWFPIASPSCSILKHRQRVWGRIYKLHFLKLHRVRFNVEFGRFSDVCFIIDVFSADCSVTIDRSIKYYRMSADDRVSGDKQTIYCWRKAVEYICAETYSRAEREVRRSIMYCLLSSAVFFVKRYDMPGRRYLLAALASPLVEGDNSANVPEILDILRTQFSGERDLIKTFERITPRVGFKRSLQRARNLLSFGLQD